MTNGDDIESEDDGDGFDRYDGEDDDDSNDDDTKIDNGIDNDNDNDNDDDDDDDDDAPNPPCLERGVTGQTPGARCWGREAGRSGVRRYTRWQQQVSE